MKFECIQTEKASFPITLMCRQLEVSTSGFYAWLSRPPSARSIANKRLVVEVKAVHAKSRGNYGSPRVYAELVANGAHVGKNRVARVMRENGIVARRKKRFRHTTDSQHDMPVAPNTLSRARSTSTNRTRFG